jgi:hypothetical protein
MPREKIAIAAVTSQGAHCAISAMRTHHEIVIDPVETGFLGQPGMSRETQSSIPAGETCNRRFLMEVTPPESLTGFA